jgi:hypothetical protein
MKGTPRVSIAADQTAGASAVVRVVLQNAALAEDRENVPEEDLLFGHFLLGVLRDA